MPHPLPNPNPLILLFLQLVHSFSPSDIACSPRALSSPSNGRQLTFQLATRVVVAWFTNARGECDKGGRKRRWLLQTERERERALDFYAGAAACLCPFSLSLSSYFSHVNHLTRGPMRFFCTYALCSVHLLAVHVYMITSRSTAFLR